MVCDYLLRKVKNFTLRFRNTDPAANWAFYGPLPPLDVPSVIPRPHYHEVTCALRLGSPRASTQARLALARMSTRFLLAGIILNGARSGWSRDCIRPGCSFLARLRLQTLSGAFRQTGTSRGIPARPSGGRTACGIAWLRVPSLMACLRLSAAPLLGAEVPPRLP